MQVANKGMRRGFPHSMGVIHKCALPPLGRFTSDEAARLALDLAKTDDSMASIYADASGKDAAFWLDVMAQEKRFSAAEMLEIGLIDEILTNTRAQALATEIENQLTLTNIMDIKKHLQRISAFAAKIAGKKAMEIELEDGTKLFIYTEDGEIVEKQAVLMGEDGLPTEENAPVGTHTLLDGRSIVVGEGGIIIAVEESELAKAHATIASLEGQLAEATAAIAASVAAINAADLRIDALSRKQSTTYVPAARTAASVHAAPAADALDAIGILARAKGISREDAQLFYSKQSKNK
jgi:enoyl-CoA hydratase/carnithine racemase